MVPTDYKYFVVLFRTKKSRQNIATDLTLEIYESVDIAKQVLSEYFFSCKTFFHTTSHITHLNYPRTQQTVKELISFLQNNDHQAIVDLMRDWIASNNIEKHCAISGFVFTGLKKALYPSQLLFCPVSKQPSIVSSIKTLSKVRISDGWVEELENGDSCPLLGCVPFGEGYVAWNLYTEATSVPILGLIDFCRHQKKLTSLEHWCVEYAETPVAKVLKAICQIEGIEIALSSLFI